MRAVSSRFSALLLVFLCEGCASPVSPTSGKDAGDPPDGSPSTFALSGTVFEIRGGSRTPAPNHPLWAQVGPPPWTSGSFSYPRTTTDSAGRYTFRDLPAGHVAVVFAGGPGFSADGYLQLCAAGVKVGPGGGDLDIEVTSSGNPEPSPGPRALVVSGQIYEMTPAGRVGLAGATLAVDWSSDTWLWGAISADAEGRYTMCGIPAGWPLTIYAGKPESGHEYVSVGAVFNATATFDIEVRRRSQ